MASPSSSPSDRQFRLEQLAPELLKQIFGRLQTPDVLRAELCCRSWRRLLTDPQVSGLLGDVTLELDKLPFTISRNQIDDSYFKTEVERFLPLCRWLTKHQHGFLSVTAIVVGRSSLGQWCRLPSHSTWSLSASAKESAARSSLASAA
ncbi:hypothetical protein WJX73_004938 [Symbiochloris irregularis]|uniref:F-box domain-containing protein n=1 Tax=Symbiochloris irregularis TaxID=706552 RepID=A0AAW1NYN0_9CHLO